MTCPAGMLRRVIDVLPRALVAAASGVRAFARELEPVQAAPLGDGELTSALQDVCTAWGTVASALRASAEECAAGLDAGAAEYVEVESLLVPAALR